MPTDRIRSPDSRMCLKSRVCPAHDTLIRYPDQAGRRIFRHILGACMSMRTVPPFRADHVGSLLRPRHLLTAREELAAGAITAVELRAIEDEAIREVVALQRDAGLRSVTDGEFRRASWHMDFIYQIGGIAKVPGSLVSTFRGPEGDITFTPDAIRVTRKLTMDATIFG